MFTKSLQAKWFNSLSNTLCNDISTSWKNDGVAFDPKVVVQSLTDLLREESAAQGKEVDDSFYQSLEELQTDPDFNTILTEFDDALNGKRNMMTIGMLVRWLVATVFLCVSVLSFKLIPLWFKARLTDGFNICPTFFQQKLNGCWKKGWMNGVFKRFQRHSTFSRTKRMLNQC